MRPTNAEATGAAPARLRAEGSNVGVVGKKFPTSTLGRLIVHHPTAFAALFLLPLIPIFDIVFIGFRHEHTLDDFKLGEMHEAARAERATRAAVHQWLEELSGSSTLAGMVNTSQPKSHIRDRVELRVAVDYKKLSAFQQEGSANLLDPRNMQALRLVEDKIEQASNYKELCFTNNLEYGTLQEEAPICAPVSSLTQYYFPRRDTAGKWHMDGAGPVVQTNPLPLLFSNSNYRWFTDHGVSSNNPHAAYLRSQFTLASSPDKSDKMESIKYRMSYIRFVATAFRAIFNVSHPYLVFTISGPSVEDTRTINEMQYESLKIPIAMAICFVCTWVHTGSFVIGVYTAVLVPFVMFSAAGILAITRGPLPFFLVPSVVWVMSFTMHATLSYFDTFVASGSMPTSGRRNNLSLDQRVSFTLRHATRGVWVANIIAISLFAVGTRSGYMVVRQNSFLLLVAVIINVYLITLVTPAVLVLHHLILSNRRRDMQKQIDIINNHAKVMPRQEALFPVLRELKIQDEPASIEAGDGESASEGEGVSRGSLRKRLQRQFQAAAATAVWDTRQGIAGAMHKARKRKEEMVRRRQDLDEAEDGLPAFCIDDFIEVGLANPLGGVEASMPERSTRCLYFNPRMVRQSDVIHIPFPMTQRSVTSWTAMSNAISDQPATEPPTAPPEVQRIAEELGGECNSIETWAMSWRHVGDVLGVEGAADNQLLPLAVRALVKSQSLSWVVGSGNSSSNGVGGGGGGAPSRISTDVVVETNIDAVEEEELTGWGIRKLKYRWRHRHEHGRQGCWGLLGTRMDETPEQRDARIMKRKMKRVDFDVVESCSYSFFAPALYKVRWLLVVFLLALFITSCVIGLRVVPGPQLFTILDDDGRADVFHALDGVFGQQGTCEFCGPYYASADRFHLASDRDLSICRAQGYTDQINMLVDRCDVCNGTNECVDCAGNVNGTHEESMCGGCVDRESSVDACSCQLQHDCPYCEWALNISDMGGTNCSVKCTKDTCGSHGHCDGYTAKCVCEEQFTGETCGECREGFLPHNVNPNCTLECDADHDSSECVCNISVGRCTRCPPGMIGVYCNVTKVECDHGMFDTVSMKCVCFPGYAGERCELATNCSLRGRWLTAAESPLPSGDGCGCIGHWRGPSCQLCDCLNGGMCDPTTGACLCQGGFEGERCQACAAGCVAKGDCPEPSLEYWNIRTCISEHCTEVDREEEVACSACEIQKGPSTSYCKAYGQQECNADTECWWDKTTATCDWARAYDVPAVDAALSCSCNQPTVWGGSTCDTCLGPAGSTCTVEGTITGCNGLSYTDPALVVVTDACGVCGGDGFCRGCDGIPNSGLVADDCGLCGGHNNCNDTSAPPINVTYFLGLTNMGEMFGDPSWCKAVLRLCAALSMMRPFPVSCFLADYLQSVGLNYVPSVQSVFDFAAANRRFREVGFSMQHGTPLSWNYMLLNSHSETRIDAAAGDINTNYKDEREILENISGILHETRINVWVSSPSWPPAIAEVESEHTLLLVILIGCLFTLAAVHIYFISIVVAIGLTLGAMTVLFGALVACVVMSWKLDAVLELCVIPVVPIAVEYLVNLASGYFDFLRINTSHLFARDVTRKVAFQGALKFALPSIFTSCIACIGVALTLNVSVVLSCIRTGQIAITAHLLVLLVVVLFSGVLCALGPLRDIGHWTLSLAVGIFWGALLGLGLMLFSSSMK